MSQFQNKHEGPVSVEFTVSSFRYKGVEYKSADVVKAAEQGNEEAQTIIARLVEMKSGHVQTVPVYAEAAPEEEAPEELAPSPKKSKKR